MTASGVPPAVRSPLSLCSSVLQLPPGVVQHRGKESLRVADLNLPAAQGHGQIVVELVESRLVVARADDEKVGICALAQSLRAGHGNAQRGKARLPAEVPHQRDEGFNLLLGRRGRQHHRGPAQVGTAA